MSFLTVDQMKTHIYAGVRNAITNNDDTLVQDAIDAAVAEAQGYLSRFDTDLLFNVAGASNFKADPMLLNSVKSMAKWHFITLANPNIDYEDAQIRYDDAVKWLEKIQSTKVVPKGWPLLTPAEKSNLWHIHSKNKKRNNQFGPPTNGLGYNINL